MREGAEGGGGKRQSSTAAQGSRTREGVEDDDESTFVHGQNRDPPSPHPPLTHPVIMSAVELTVQSELVSVARHVWEKG